MSMLTLPEGTFEVPVSVLDLDRRLRDGDPTMGWRGDPSMRLCFNEQTRRFEVWARDGHGRDYVAITSDGVSPRILADLAASDWQRGKGVLREVLEREEARHRDREAYMAELRGAASEKFAWHAAEAFRQSTGHVGRGKRIFSMAGGR